MKKWHDLNMEKKIPKKNLQNKIYNTLHKAKLHVFV